jgi:hypothetical protein
MIGRWQRPGLGNFPVRDGIFGRMGPSETKPADAH